MENCKEAEPTKLFFFLRLREARGKKRIPRQCMQNVWISGQREVRVERDPDRVERLSVEWHRCFRKTEKRAAKCQPFFFRSMYRLDLCRAVPLFLSFPALFVSAVCICRLGINGDLSRVCIDTVKHPGMTSRGPPNTCLDTRHRAAVSSSNGHLEIPPAPRGLITGLDLQREGRVL